MAKNKSREFKIPKDAELFATLSFKDYKDDWTDDYQSKKDKKKSYYQMLLNELPAVIKLLVSYMNVSEVSKMKDAFYARISDAKFIKKLTKAIENDDEIENIEMMPIVIFDMIKEASIRAKVEQEDDPDMKGFDLTDLITISNMILKKKMKRLVKAGIGKELAFDCLSVIPTSKVLEKGGIYRLRQLMQVIYAHAKVEEVDFETIAKHVVTPSCYPMFFTYLLLERKSEYVNLDDKQKAFFNTITDWTLTYMNDNMEKAQIKDILSAYFKERQKCKEMGKDSNRRFFLGSLPEDKFGNICKVLNKMKSSDSSIEEFL